MILNGYAVLDGLTALLRLGLAILVIGLAATTWRLRKQSLLAPEARNAFEDRCYLLYMLSGLLLGLNLLSWPIFYLLLQSYVPQWPGVMCIYGVTQIGAGSVGPSRFLPALVSTMEISKPAVVFLSGAWFVLYLINKQTRTAPLTGRVLALLLLAGTVSLADAAVELTYLVIPKTEEFLSVGCCVAAFGVETRTGRLLPEALLAEETVPWLYGSYYLANLGMATALWLVGRAYRSQIPALTAAPLLLGAGLTLVINLVFLVEAAAPRLLHLPSHHCPYDLVPLAPTSLVPVGLFVAASFLVGWACCATWLGNDAEAAPFARRLASRLLHLAWLGYMTSTLMLSAQLALA